MHHNEPHEKIAELLIDSTTAQKVREINLKYDNPNGRITGDALDCIRFVSPVMSMSEEEILITRWVEILNVLGGVPSTFFQGYMASMAYNGGTSTLVWIGPPEDGPLATAKERREAEIALDVLNTKTTYLKSRKVAYESALGLLYDATKKNDGVLGGLLNAVLHGGSGWFSAQDMEESHSFTFDGMTTTNLLLGSFEEGGVWYKGEKSLVTIAAPGSGKTQCHVLPALKFFEGSAVVLDIKGECFEETAHLRKGDVFKFSPYEYQTSHHYNPLDFISRDPMLIWNDAGVLAAALIRPDSKTEDHWERRARDQLAAFICYVVLYEDNKSMENVMDCLAASEEELTCFAEVMSGSEVGGLRRAGKAMLSLLARSPKMFESNIETMRGHLSVWEDDRLTSITKHSDWNPSVLRERPTTIYLCVPLEAVQIYSSVLRVMIAQHVAALTPADNPHKAPVSSLLLLDEAPQLGRMEPITKAIEVGRGYGLRTWLFAQYIGQLHHAYGRDIAEGMINSCGVVSYMNIGEDNAPQISRQLGERHSLIHGNKTPLASASELTGPKFRNSVISLAQGEYPLLIDKVFFHQLQKME